VRKLEWEPSGFLPFFYILLGIFDHIVCLNLEIRPDRKAQAIAEFRLVGLQNVEFFPAFLAGYSGFNKSQRAIFQKYEGSLFVFEDDVKFINNIHDVDRILEELPADWDVVYLGANLKSNIKRYSENLYFLKDAWTTHAIGYSEKMVRWLKENYDGTTIYDEWLRVYVQPEKKCFITAPMLATQRDGFSNIMGRDTSYNLEERCRPRYAT